MIGRQGLLRSDLGGSFPGPGLVGLHGSDGSAAGPGPGLGQRLFVEVGPLGAAGQVGLHLAELGQIERGDLLSLLDLLLVGLHLTMQLIMYRF